MALHSVLFSLKKFTRCDGDSEIGRLNDLEPGSGELWVWVWMLILYKHLLWFLDVTSTHPVPAKAHLKNFGFGTYKVHMDLCFSFLPQICSVAAVARIPSCKALWENLQCIWRAPYIHHFPSKKMGGKLCLLIGVRTLPLLRSRHNVHPTPVPCDLCKFGSW